MKNLKLKSLRAKKDLKQSDIAKVLNISNNSYCEKENGKRQFKVKEAIILSDFLGVDIKDIFLK